jgi:NADPH2:quinone reductase
LKALVCRAPGPLEALEYADLPEPRAGEGQVVVAVRAAGVNFPDVLVAQGKYQFKPEPPFAPGFELAGIVEAVGAGVTHVRPGDRVMAIVTHGAFAQKALVPAERVMALPDGADLEAAAAMMFTYATSYHALKDRGALAPGETLLVLGAAGGVGLAAVDLGKLMGARVIAAASSADKLALCREYGAEETIDYAKEDLREGVKRITGAQGVDVVCDPVGGAYSEAAFRSLAWKGRHLVIGFTAGEIPKLPLNLPLLKGASLVGVFLGAFLERERPAAAANARQLIDWLAAGKIRPHVSARYPLERGAEALAAVAQRKVKGKVLVIP